MVGLHSFFPHSCVSEPARQRPFCQPDAGPRPRLVHLHQHHQCLVHLHHRHQRLVHLVSEPQTRLPEPRAVRGAGVSARRALCGPVDPAVLSLRHRLHGRPLRHPEHGALPAGVHDPVRQLRHDHGDFLLDFGHAVVWADTVHRED